MSKKTKEEFAEFVCEICEENLGKTEKRNQFVASLESEPAKIEGELRFSLEHLAVTAENRKVIANRTEIGPDDIPQIMCRITEWFLDSETEKEEARPQFLHVIPPCLR